MTHAELKSMQQHCTFTLCYLGKQVQSARIDEISSFELGFESLFSGLMRVC